MEKARTLFDVYADVCARSRRRRSFALSMGQDMAQYALNDAACEYYFIQEAAPDTLEEKLENGSNWDLAYMESTERFKRAAECFMSLNGTEWHSLSD